MYPTLEFIGKFTSITILEQKWYPNTYFFLTLKAPSKICSRGHSNFFFFIFQRKQVLIFHVNRLLGKQTIHMKCWLFSEKKKKNCHLLQLWLALYGLIICNMLSCGYSLEVPQQGASNECPQHMLPQKIKKNIYLATVSSGAIQFICRTTFRCCSDDNWTPRHCQPAGLYTGWCGLLFAYVLFPFCMTQMKMY